MENKMQDSKREELYKKLKRDTYSRGDRYDKNGVDTWGDEYADNDKYHASIYNKGVKDALELFASEISKAREEGFIKGVKECTEKLSKLTTK